MKKKITALCLVVALALVAIGGATMAYFTDKDQQNNTFAIGNIDIKVDEYGYVCDKDGDMISDAIDYTEGGMSYTNIMPSYVMSKRPFVKNESTRNAAYVRVAVVMNHVNEINANIDDFYEAKGKNADEIQAIYDEVFNGWNLNYSKREGRSGVRLWMDESEMTRNGITPMYIDSIQKTATGQVRVDYTNNFMSDAEKTQIDSDNGGNWYGDVLQTGVTSYYDNAVQNNERVYVFYLRLDAGQSYGTQQNGIFGGLTAPAEFNNEQMKMFEGLQIGIYADAIQTVGFDSANDAFTALEAEHPLGWWNAE